MSDKKLTYFEQQEAIAKYLKREFEEGRISIDKFIERYMRTLNDASKRHYMNYIEFDTKLRGNLL